MINTCPLKGDSTFPGLRSKEGWPSVCEATVMSKEETGAQQSPRAQERRVHELSIELFQEWIKSKGHGVNRASLSSCRTPSMTGYSKLWQCHVCDTDYAPQSIGRGASGPCLIQGSPTPTLLVPSTCPGTHRACGLALAFTCSSLL